MGRLIVCIIFLVAAGACGAIGVPALLAEHSLMRAAQQVNVLVTSAEAQDSRSSKRSNRRYYATVSFTAQTPDGPVASQYLDPALTTRITFRKQTSRDEWKSQYAAQQPAQAWLVPAASLPLSISNRIGTNVPLLFLEKRYKEQYAVMVGLAAVLAGIGIAVLGNARSSTSVKMRAVNGSDPPVQEVIATHNLWSSAATRLIGALVALLPTIALGLFFIIGAAGQVPTIFWWALVALTLVSIVLSLMAFSNILDALSFEQPRVFIEQSVLVVGRQNMIALTAKTKSQPTEPVTLTLQCTRVTIVGSGKQQQVKRTTEWSHTLKGHALVMSNASALAAVGGGFSQQDAWLVPLPSDAQPTRKYSQSLTGYEWTIKLKQQTRNVKLAVEFPVRVDLA
jgi:hypothetical protein